MPELDTGRRVTYQLPPPLSSPEFEPLEKAKEDYKRIVQERTVTYQRMSALSREREAVERRSREALSKAIKQSKPRKALEEIEAKTQREIDKLEKERAACERRIEAIEEAIDEAESDLIAVLDQHRDEWLVSIEASFEAVRSNYEEAVEVMSALRERVSREMALWHFLRGFPDTVPSYKVGVGVLASLIGRNEEAFTVPQVIAALREDAQVRPKTPLPRDPLAAETQRQHEERQANQDAGLGYFTDAEAERLRDNPEEFWGGAGAKLMRRLPAADGANGR